MRYLALTLLGGWTLGMAVIFGFGLFMSWWAIDSVILHGQTSTFNGQPQSWAATLALDLWFFGCYLTGSGGFMIAGIMGLRSLWRQGQDSSPHQPVPRLRGRLLVVKEPHWLPIWFAVLVMVFPLGVTLALLASSWPPSLSDLAGPLCVGGIFTLSGCAILHEFALNWLAFDLEEATWQTKKGLWPFRTVASGPLSEASHLVVAQEMREGAEGGDYPVNVVRLVWSAPDRPALILTETSAVSSLWWNGRNDKLERWAHSLAGSLKLPVKVEIKNP